MADGIDVDDAEAPPPRPRFLARPNPRNSPALILCAGIVFSFGPLIFRLTTGTTGAWQYLVYRFAGLVASGTLWLCVTLPAGWKLRLTRRRVARSALGGCLMMGCNICFIVALERIDSATTLLLQTLAPFSAALLGWLVRRERTDFVTWCSMVLAVVGTAIMGSEWDASDPIGLCAAMGIAVLLGGYAVVLRGTDEAAPEPRVQFLLNGVFGLATALLIVCASQGAAALRVPARDAICGLSAGGLCLGLGIPLYQAAGRHVAPARTTLLLLSEVILAPLWTFAFASEVPTGRTIGGGSVLLLAIVWLTLHPGPPDAETGASASANGSGGGGGLPLAFFSPNVIKQVQASLDTKTGDGDQRQRRRSAWADDFEGESADHPVADAATAEATVAQRQAAGGNLQLIRITDGGWAADLSECRPATGAASGERAVAGVHVAYFPEAEDYPDPDGIDPSWALDRECALWREKAQAQARNAKLNRSVLSVVDDFFAGDVAAGFVLD